MCGKGRFPRRKISMGSERIGTKLHEPDDKELKYFQLFWSGCADHTRWKSVQTDAYFPEWKPALIKDHPYYPCSVTTGGHFK